MPMVVTDPNLPGNPTVFANQAFEDMTGYESASIVGRDWSFLQGARTDLETVAQLHAAVADCRTIAVDLLSYRRDGTPFWNAIHLTPVYDGAGGLMHFFSTHLDVTGRRASEQAARQAHATAAIGRFTAGLAHDFNNLLQVASGSLELLRPKLADARLHRYLDDAGTAADRLAALTAQLLACGQKTRLEPEAVDLNALVTGLGGRLADAAGTGIHLRFDLSARLSPTRVDPVHLERALLGVLANARQAMPEGGRVTVATSSASGGGGTAASLPLGDYVVLSVADEGQGMSAEVLERATEPFFTTRPTGHGSGLGLAMVHGFVAQSLGRLDIASQPGRGTTVRMVLPAACGGAPSPPGGSVFRTVQRVRTSPRF